MNPKATPENIAAAQKAVAEQTAATVADIEAKRPVNRAAQDAALSAVMKAVEDARASLRASLPIVRFKLVAREMQYIRGAESTDPILKGQIVRLVSPHLHGGGATDEVYPEDLRDQEVPSALLDVVIHGTEARFEQGKEYYIEVIPADSVNSGHVPAPPMPAREHLPVSEGGKSGAGVGEGTAIDGDLGRKAFTPEQEAARRAELGKQKVAMERLSAPQITGTTGSHGTTDASVRLTPAGGPPPDHNDPNLTGPSSDKQQPVKGEIVEGQQTGGTSGAGTSDGRREDSQFARHHGAAGDEAKGEAAQEK